MIRISIVAILITESIYLNNYIVYCR